MLPALHTSPFQQWTPQTIGMAELLKPISGQEIWTHCPENSIPKASHLGSHSHLLSVMTSAVQNWAWPGGLKRVLLVGEGVQH